MRRRRVLVLLALPHTPQVVAGHRPGSRMVGAHPHLPVLALVVRLRTVVVLEVRPHMVGRPVMAERPVTGVVAYGVEVQQVAVV